MWTRRISSAFGINTAFRSAKAPARLTDMVSNFVEPLEARRIEKDIQQEVQKLLEAFVVAGVTELPKGKNGKG